MMYTAVLPTLDCYRLHHKMQSRLKSPGPGRYDICVVCSLGYEMAYTQSGGDDEQADRFVQELRRETKPVG